MSTASKTFITPDGGIALSIPGSEMTWFEFLCCSRASNSKAGSWNSKTHWKTSGLDEISRKDFLTQWTNNSLKSKSMPTPRTKDFRLDREMSEARAKTGKTSPGHENALNAMLFKERGKSGTAAIESLGNAYAIGYEVPLAAESDGQLKVDLFGVSKNIDSIEIIELKKSANTSDSPLIALVEAICYGVQTIRCQDSIRPELNKALSALGHASLAEDTFKNINLTIAAPCKYWDHWCDNRYSLPFDELQGCFGKIIGDINATLMKHASPCSFTVRLSKLLPKMTVSAGNLGALTIDDEGVFPTELCLDDELVDRFEVWRMLFKERDEMANFDLAAFNREGRAIAQDFQDFFDGKYTVSYLCLLDTDGTNSASWKEEMVG